MTTGWPPGMLQDDSKPLRAHLRTAIRKEPHEE